MNMDRFEKGPREILNPEIQKGHAFMFLSEMGSENFDKFLNLLGDTVALQGWAGYRGGLDTKNDTTGLQSIYTVYQGHELMFHVSTMLPYSKENKQQVPFSPQNMLNRRSFSDVLPESPKSARKKEEARQAEFVRIGQPWESQSFCCTFPYEIVCADSNTKTKMSDVVLVQPSTSLLLCLSFGPGCHLYSINTHHGSELRIVVAIRTKLLLITRKHPRFSAVATGADSPVEEFQYIREICLCDPPVVMALVDGPTGENDNMICVAYKHQFDLINESTGDAYRLHHVDANRVNFVAAIDVYEDGEAGLLLCYNYICYYKKVCPFNGSTPMIQSNTSDFHFSWNQMPNAIGR
ncbi:hypothetical protein GOODEAATRI_009718 [Goodea atripinnis]|uniref:Rap-GAP domain-containing protein n=1 Tax=Goodea atripinnis TaxID=208336 RepID=A0ABV0PWP4_9TELE